MAGALGAGEREEYHMARYSYPPVAAGEWISPRRAGYYMKCCDCGLVHRMHFRLVRNPRGSGRKIQLKAYRIEARPKRARGAEAHRHGARAS